MPIAPRIVRRCLRTRSRRPRNIYIYQPEQRSQWGDHFFPTGTVQPFSNEPFDFGPDFESRYIGPMVPR